MIEEVNKRGLVKKKKSVVTKIIKRENNDVEVLETDNRDHCLSSGALEDSRLVEMNSFAGYSRGFNEVEHAALVLLAALEDSPSLLPDVAVEDPLEVQADRVFDVWLLQEQQLASISPEETD